MNRRRGSVRTIVIVLGIIGALCVLGCLGIVGLGYFGIGVVMDQAMAALNENPIVQERVGEITELEMDWVATGNQEGDNVLVFEFIGTQADGVITAEIITTATGAEKVVSGNVELSSGETYDLFPPEKAAPSEEGAPSGDEPSEDSGD